MPQTKEERNEKQRAQRATPEGKRKMAAGNKKYREENREEINAKKRARGATPEGKAKKKTATAKYREENKEEINEKRRAGEATPEGKAKRRKYSRTWWLRKNPDAREQERFVGNNAERYEHYMNLSKTVEIDDRAVPSCPPDPCLIGWKATRNRGGYPLMTVSGVGQVFVHRWLWANAFGPIPEDLYITHLCNNGDQGCLTLSHLSADTPTQNSADKVHNRTTLRTLSPQTVRGIRWLHSLGFAGPTELARLYGTRKDVVRGIIHGKNYKEVTL